MHMCSSFAVILCITLINQYVYCNPKGDDRWWNDITPRQEARRRSQWTTIDNKTIPEITAQTTNRSIKRSSRFDDFTDSPVRTRNWEKSYARRRDFDRSWRDDQPIRERFVETEWDDDLPVRHVFRDTSSAVDEGDNRHRFGDEIPRSKLSRQWGRDDWPESVRPSMRDVFNSARNVNKNNKNNNNNDKSSSKPRSGSGEEKSDRVLNLNFQDPDSKRKDRERLDKLAKQIFNIDNDSEDNEEKASPRNNGNGNGFVKNAVNSFTRNSGNNYVTTSGNDFTRNNENKQKSNKFSTDSVKPSKPKFNVAFETTSAKPDKTSNTAKFNNNDIRNVAEKPKSSTTPSSQLKFGWRSTLNHSNDQKIKNQKLQSNDSNDEDIDEDFEEDFDDETTTTTAPVRPTTRSTIRPTTRPLTRSTARPTTRTTDYTTYRYADTTRPQTTTSVTNKAINRETTFLTTSRPKSTATASKPATNDLDNSLAPNKKQHRMGSWVDSDSLDYEEGDNPPEDNWSNAPLNDKSGPRVDRTQPLVPFVEEDEFEEEQLPERVQDSAEVSPELPPPEAQQFARQSAAAGDESDEQSGWRLEDALPGVPGTDYATFATIPKTNFDCKTHEWPGYYADVETQCQVFHICQAGGRINSFLCPNGTMFNQQVFVCDWWHNVQCGDSPTHYALNEKIYDHNWESKRISTTETEGALKRSGALNEEAEPITTSLDATTEPKETDGIDSSSEDKKEIVDNTNESLNEFSDEDNEETGRSTRVRSPIRIYRTSRIITPGQDRQKRRRRKRGYLKV